MLNTFLAVTMSILTVSHHILQISMWHSRCKICFSSYSSNNSFQIWTSHCFFQVLGKWKGDYWRDHKCNWIPKIFADLKWENLDYLYSRPSNSRKAITFACANTAVGLFRWAINHPCKSLMQPSTPMIQHLILDHKKNKEFVAKLITCMSFMHLGVPRKQNHLLPNCPPRLICAGEVMYHPHDNFFTKRSAM